MRAKLLALVLALPLASVVVAIVRAELQRAQSEAWTFVASGYDPRDLLHGRYVQFRIDFAAGRERTTENLACSNEDPACCLCLTRTQSSDIPLTRRMSCADAAQSCDGMLQTRLIERLDRYSVSEEQAEVLEERVRTAGSKGRLHVVLWVDPSGQAEVKELRIAGERL
jgi:uncharacterized membrane-anchored protein